MADHSRTLRATKKGVASQQRYHLSDPAGTTIKQAAIAPLNATWRWSWAKKESV
jgi:hypothetical protein